MNHDHTELRKALNPDIEPWVLPHLARALGGEVVHLPSGKPVYATTKVLIGVRAGERQDARVFQFNRDHKREPGLYAEKVQTSLLHAASRALKACTQDKCRQGRKPCPSPARCVIPLDGSLFARIVRALRWLRMRWPL